MRVPWEVFLFSLSAFPVLGELVGSLESCEEFVDLRDEPGAQEEVVIFTAECGFVFAKIASRR